MVGTIGDITCFSFYATKTITTGEGGMAVTENPEWAERMRLMSLHGMSRDAWKRYTAEGAWYYEIIAPGYKYNLTDLAAAIGMQQLKKCDYFWQRRCHYAALYTEGLRDLPEITVPVAVTEGAHAWHLYVIQLHLGGGALPAVSSSIFLTNKASEPVSILFPCTSTRTTRRPLSIAAKIFLMLVLCLIVSYHCPSTPK